MKGICSKCGSILMSDTKSICLDCRAEKPLRVSRVCELCRKKSMLAAQISKHEDRSLARKNLQDGPWICPLCKGKNEGINPTFSFAWGTR